MPVSFFPVAQTNLAYLLLALESVLFTEWPSLVALVGSNSSLNLKKKIAGKGVKWNRPRSIPRDPGPCL
jgi:hypothetical protein